MGIQKRHTHQMYNVETNQLDTGTIEGLVYTLTPNFQHQLNCT